MKPAGLLAAFLAMAGAVLAAPLVELEFVSDVGGSDLLAWQNGYPTPSGARKRDGDGDGDVNGRGFLFWQNWHPYS